jgi:hypothetical protein
MSLLSRCVTRSFVTERDTRSDAMCVGPRLVHRWQRRSSVSGVERIEAALMDAFDLPDVIDAGTLDDLIYENIAWAREEAAKQAPKLARVGELYEAGLHPSPWREVGTD